MQQTTHEMNGNDHPAPNPILTPLTYNREHGPAPAKPSLAVPQQANERRSLIALVRDFAETRGLTPPLCMEELDIGVRELHVQAEFPEAYINFVKVLLNNQVWRDKIAAIPFERRTLLLPPCMRNATKCPAKFDEFGLLCEQCNCCAMGKLVAEAETLGYAVLIAEGTSIVTTLIERGMIDAVIGVSCLTSMERAFPFMVAEAVPGIAIPLLHDGCSNTAVDTAWLRDEMNNVNTNGMRARMDLNKLRGKVDAWFTGSALQQQLGRCVTQTEEIACSWLGGSGKRWRPFLCAAVYQAIHTDANRRLPVELQRTAMAVECFHKASLIHDDIEDDDDLRYGVETLHKRYGVPIALNAGDFLLGEGYRLITEAVMPDKLKADMLAVVARGHRDLCVGQGLELSWMRDPRSLTSHDVLEIFKLKTAPAFEVALRLGALCGDAPEYLHPVLAEYSRCMGIAYQIKDDLQDFNAEDASDISAGRPSILPAIAWERAQGQHCAAIEQCWCSGAANRAC